MILELFKELEIILSDLVFSGIDNIDYNLIENIDSIGNKLYDLKMLHAKALMDNLTVSIKEYKKNGAKLNLEKVSINISKLEFYLSYALFDLSD